MVAHMASSLEAKREREVRKCKDKLEGAGSPVDKEAPTTRLISLYALPRAAFLVLTWMAWFQTCLRFLPAVHGILARRRKRREIGNDTGNDFRLIDFGTNLVGIWAKFWRGNRRAEMMWFAPNARKLGWNMLCREKIKEKLKDSSDYK